MDSFSPLKFAGAALLCLGLFACGGSNGGNSALENINNQHNNNSSGSSTSSGAIDTVSAAKLGYGSGTAFEDGVISIAGISAGGKLSAGGTTTLTVNIVSSTNNLVTSSTDITFNSECYASQEATFADATTGSATNRITTSNGEASIIFKDNGCAKTDTITATATLNGSVKTAQALLVIERDSVQSIKYLDASPERISLKGTGGQETSVVRFTITGSTGIPVKDVSVSLALNTDIGGLCIVDSANSSCGKSITTVSDKNGIASAIVQAGTIAAPIRITATDTDTNTTTQSNQLIVSTGIPDQDSMSMSLEYANPQAWEYDLVNVDVTVSLADAFNNPPPEGTSVSFWAEGGKIEPGCTTNVAGNCTVVWQSSDPRPLNGRVTILAFAQGNESFTDLNGDGYYDRSDRFTPALDDFSEAYQDDNENGRYDADSERFVDFNKDGAFTPGNGIYNGVLCNDTEAHCTKTGIHIRKSAILIMSSARTGYIRIDQPIQIAIGGTKTVTLRVADIHFNSMPMGTKISILSSAARNIDVELVSDTVVSEIEENLFDIILTASETALPSGSFTVRVTAPDGKVNAQTFIINPE